MKQPSSRQELYDRIRESSKDEVILEEMIRLGFWPDDGERPFDPADEIRRKGELERELNALRTENTRLHNIEALKKEAHRRRLKESRERQLENKKRKEEERLARARAWEQTKTHDIIYLGPSVSGGLNHKGGDDARLKAEGLPVLQTADTLATAMGISVGQLRFLSFDRKTSKVSHYVRFKVPKKTGGERLISAPRQRLKSAQRWVLENVLDKVAVHDAAHGFRHQRSIVSNARPHVDQKVVINLDLENFFPTISYRRVRGMFRALGYSEQAATILGLLSTEPDTVTLDLDGVTYYVTVGERRLPQGAPTSPAVTNVICRRLDKRLSTIAARLGFQYTRYADDLTFSGPNAEHVEKLLRQTRHVVEHEGFKVHPKKTRVFRRGRRQEVTGLTVNGSGVPGAPTEAPRVSRAVLRRFRATLYQIEKDGPEGKTWGAAGSDVLHAVYGFASYVAMVDPAKGTPLRARANALLQKHGKRPPAPPPPPPPKPRAEPPPASRDQARGAQAQRDSAPARDPKKPWWKFW